MTRSSGTSDQILIVDDDRAVVEVLAELLRAAGHACTTATGSREAHALLDERPFALLLTDVNMPTAPAWSSSAMCSRPTKVSRP